MAVVCEKRVTISLIESVYLNPIDALMRNSEQCTFRQWLFIAAFSQCKPDEADLGGVDWKVLLAYCVFVCSDWRFVDHDNEKRLRASGGKL